MIWLHLFLVTGVTCWNDASPPITLSLNFPSPNPHIHRLWRYIIQSSCDMCFCCRKFHVFLLLFLTLRMCFKGIFSRKLINLKLCFAQNWVELISIFCLVGNRNHSIYCKYEPLVRKGTKQEWSWHQAIWTLLLEEQFLYPFKTFLHLENVQKTKALSSFCGKKLEPSIIMTSYFYKNEGGFIFAFVKTRKNRESEWMEGRYEPEKRKAFNLSRQ